MYGIQGRIASICTTKSCILFDIDTGLITNEMIMNTKNNYSKQLLGNGTTFEGFLWAILKLFYTLDCVILRQNTFILVLPSFDNFILNL